MFINEFVIVVVLFIKSVCFIWGKCFCLLVKFVLVVIVISVFELLKRLISKNEKMILNKFKLNVLVIFICLIIEFKFGGIEIILWKVIVGLKIKVSFVMSVMEINMFEWMFLVDKIIIIKKLSIFNKIFGLCKLFKVIKVLVFGIIMFIFLKLIKVINKLIFVLILICKLCGIDVIN